MYTIKNDILEVSVKLRGAELCSIKSISKGIEFIWGADPKVWGDHSPVLFPIIGRLKDDSYLYRKKLYHMPKHGFARKNLNFSLLKYSHDELSFILENNAETQLIYPFIFKFIVTYKLVNNTVIIGYTIKNVDKKEMYFSVGGHPAFKCPLGENEQYADYFLEFDKTENAETWIPSKDGLIGHDQRPVIEEGRIILLNKGLFDRNALVFKKLNSSAISLTNKQKGKVLSVFFEGFPYLGIWSIPGAKFVCIEPWLGIADSIDSDQQLENKEGIIRINGGQVFKVQYSILINERG